MTDLNPLILALAAFVIAATPAVVAWLAHLSAGKQLDRIETQTNSHLTSLTAEVAQLHAPLEERRCADLGAAASRSTDGK